MRIAVLLALVLALVSPAAAGTPELSMETATGGDQVCPTGTAQYSLTVTNPGPASDTYTMDVSAPWPDSGTLARTSLSLEDGESITFPLFLQAPESANRGSHGFSVSARSGNTGDRVSVSGTVDVLSCRAVTAEVVESAGPVCRGDTAEYTVRVRNTGRVQETYRIEAERGTVATERVTLGAGEKRDITITMSDREAMSTTVPVTVESTSSYASDTVDLQFDVEACRAMELRAADEIARCAGTDTAVNATVTNRGTVADTYTVTVDGTTWNVSVPAGETRTVQHPVTVAAGETTIDIAAVSHGLDAVSAERSVDLTGERCYGVRVDTSTDMTESGDTALLELDIRNNGTRPNTYAVQIDGPEWMTAQPRRVNVAAGDATTVYLFAAPEHASNGTYSSKIVVTGEGVRQVLPVDITVTADGEITADVRTATPTGAISTRPASILVLVLTTLVLFVGGYWYFNRWTDLEDE